MRHGLLKFWAFSPHRKGAQYPTDINIDKTWIIYEELFSRKYPYNLRKHG